MSWGMLTSACTCPPPGWERKPASLYQASVAGTIIEAATTPRMAPSSTRMSRFFLRPNPILLRAADSRRRDRAPTRSPAGGSRCDPLPDRERMAGLEYEKDGERRETDPQPRRARSPSALRLGVGGRDFVGGGPSGGAR